MHLIIENKAKMEMFVALFQLLKNWSSNLSLHFAKDQLYIQTMDQSHICLSNITIKKDWFTEYTNINNTRICVDSVHFAIMVNYALKHQKMEIRFEDEAEPDKLFINLLSSTAKNANFDHFFELPLIDVEQDILGIPEVDYDVDFTIESKKFAELIAELNVFGSNLNVKCSEQLLELNSDGDSGKLKINIPIDDLNEYAIAEGEELDISYSLNHISRMCLSTKLGATVSVSISVEYPMSLKYDLGEDSSVAFYVAPKIAE
jgi:proliferating cell nuclear antigen